MGICPVWRDTTIGGFFEFLKIRFVMNVRRLEGIEISVYLKPMSFTLVGFL